MSSIQYFVILILCAAWISASNGYITLKSLEDRHVIIASPKDVDALLTTPDTLVLVWNMPTIYVPHDVSMKAFEKRKRGDKIEVMKTEIDHVAVKEDNNTVSDSDQTSADNSTADSTPTNKNTDDKDTSGNKDTSTTNEQDTSNLTPVVCRPLTYFANYTVGEKNATINDNGWSVSLIGSNTPMPITNTSIFYKDTKNAVVKFEKGCATKIVVSYIKKDSRRNAKEIVLNPTDRLVTIEGLTPQTVYQVIVTAHFLSGHALSAEPFFPKTLAEGAKETCKCEWYGTKNLTESCANPSKGKQHCQCEETYTGRFCETCQKGFYRDMPNDGCKRCPCDEYAAVETSCNFVEGYLYCDKCAMGYAGNVCHKCDKGYFRMGTKCEPCNCHGNTKPDAPLTCHPSTGACIDCQYNTTGYFCERCLAGYRRDPPKPSGACMRLATLPGDNPASSSDNSSSSMSPGIIGAIILVIILCISVLVGVIVFRRVRENRQRRALWTVEMRPDNDDLDFNTVHNDEAHMDDIDDMDFYEKQGRRGKSNKKYSKLTEDC